MNETELTHYLRDTFPDVETSQNFGYTFFFYKSDHKRPFASLSSSDNEHDRFSNLARPGIYRLNLGVSKPTFQSLFGPGPLDLSTYDFTTVDQFFPHPEYSAFHFISILTPSATTFERLRPLIAEAYAIAQKRNTPQEPPAADS